MTEIHLANSIIKLSTVSDDFHTSKSDPNRPFPSHCPYTVHTDEQQAYEEITTTVNKKLMKIDQNDRGRRRKLHPTTWSFNWVRLLTMSLQSNQIHKTISVTPYLTRMQRKTSRWKTTRSEKELMEIKPNDRNSSMSIIRMSKAFDNVLAS